MSARGAGELVVDRLSASYGAARVLHGLSMQLHAGEAVGVVGRNGMGKTTLVRTLMGLDPPTRTHGDISWNGVSLRRVPSHVRARRGLGYVPQGRHVFGSLTVEQNLLTTARAAADSPGWSLDLVYELFPRLRERRKNHAGNLSGGEQQMVAIGRALMTNPQLLIMDEPSEGLAPAVVDQIGDYVRALTAGGMSVLLVEQNLGLALSVVDRLYVLELGQIAFEGTPRELAADTELQRQLLGV